MKKDIRANVLAVLNPSAIKPKTATKPELVAKTEPVPPVSTPTKRKPVKTAENRPMKEQATKMQQNGRVKFTTALMPDVIKALKQTALDSGLQPADILEQVLRERFNV